MVRRLTTPLSGGQIRRHRELTAAEPVRAPVIALEGIDVNHNLEVDVAARSARTLLIRASRFSDMHERHILTHPDLCIIAQLQAMAT